MRIPWPVERLSNRQLIVIPLIFAALMTTVILVQGEGDPRKGVPLSIEFRGGTMLSVRGLEELEVDPNPDEIELAVEGFLGVDASVRRVEDPLGEVGLDMEVAADLKESEVERLKDFLWDEFEVGGEYSTKAVGPTIIAMFREQGWNALIGAFIAMGVILLIVFRHPVVFVTLACISLNVLGALGGMALFQVPLSLASLAAIILVLGYSVDTNVLLSTRMLRRVVGEPREQVIETMRTGMMMSFTTIAAMVVLNVFTTSPILYQISAVLIFGIVADLINTWFLNAGMLMQYLGRKKRREFYVGV